MAIILCRVSSDTYYKLEPLFPAFFDHFDVSGREFKHICIASQDREIVVESGNLREKIKNCNTYCRRTRANCGIDHRISNVADYYHSLGYYYYCLNHYYCISTTISKESFRCWYSIRYFARGACVFHSLELFIFFISHFYWDCFHYFLLGNPFHSIVFPVLCN